MIDLHYHPGSRYSRGISEPAGPILITGTQALVRMVLMQAERDRRAGLRRAGFVSGYRGSPLGAVDVEMWRAAQQLASAQVRFLPAINEDLAATAIIGTQKVATDPARTTDGVFAMWYGKGPGVDRAGDALKHGNYYGAAAQGGVVVVVGDDHGGVSSSMSHQSDATLIAWNMPVIHPASVQDYVRFGLWAWALSRFSGLWVGFKAISETVESSVSVDADDMRALDALAFDLPAVEQGPDGLHWRWPDLPGKQLEQRMVHKLAAALAFARANPLDQIEVPVAQPRLLIAAVGKAYLDLREAIRSAGTSPEWLAQQGVAILKVGLVSPLSPTLTAWASRAAEVFVVEEKAAVVETLLKDSLYNMVAAQRPRISGKFGAAGERLLPSDVELNPDTVATALATCLQPLGIILAGAAKARRHFSVVADGIPVRRPYLCPGCPHNTSTKLPEGSRAQLGIGCHALAAQIPSRNTSGSVQMGGEGVDWLGQSPFTSQAHVFQNLGDGTFFHSGHLALRQAVAAGTNITYKILYNDAVAMTGGQAIDGTLTVPQLTHLLAAEGVRQIYLVSPDPRAYGRASQFAAGTVVRHRDELDAVQRQLRTLPGVSVLIFDQVCAVEERRRRHSAGKPAPRTKILINEQVCEGCGDCQKKSNCMAIVPVETAFGRKRKIDQAACNSDLSCLEGFCPSFVTVTNSAPQGATLAAKGAAVAAHAASLPLPSTTLADVPFEILIAGIGGGGSVTVGAIIAQAAHLQGLAVSTLNFTGFAQKGGAVRCHIRLARTRTALHQTRIGHASADAMIAADLVVACSEDALNILRAGHTKIVASKTEHQIGAMLNDPEGKVDVDRLGAILRHKVGEARIALIDANGWAEQLLGSKYANVLLLGAAWQHGLLPLDLVAIEQAIGLNGVDCENNRLAFACGRVVAADPGHITQSLSGSVEFAAPAPAASIDTYAHYLSAYQDDAYAERFRQQVALASAAGERIGAPQVAQVVAASLFKLMAYKDEYEVARLLSDPVFIGRIKQQHGAGARLTFHLRPPIIPERWSKHVVPRTFAIGQALLPCLRLLAAMRRIRGTRFDPFSYLAERKSERQLVRDYEALLAEVMPALSPQNRDCALELLAVPQSIKGYGPTRRLAMEVARASWASLLTAFRRVPDKVTRIVPIQRVV